MKIKSSKRYKKLIEISKADKSVDLDEAIKKVKNNCWFSKINGNRG